MMTIPSYRYSIRPVSIGDYGPQYLALLHVGAHHSLHIVYDCSTRRTLGRRTRTRMTAGIRTAKIDRWYCSRGWAVEAKRQRQRRSKLVDQDRRRKKGKRARSAHGQTDIRLVCVGSYSHSPHTSHLTPHTSHLTHTRTPSSMTPVAAPSRIAPPLTLHPREWIKIKRGQAKDPRWTPRPLSNDSLHVVQSRTGLSSLQQPCHYWAKEVDWR
ncbi:uncharacterized protein LY89DRAFT_11481 [Mollisia scopiformis]|uniref:Uncharacterized protein n=1 Tax=Mollisia scopiformis TaxID=149040 RepID=A0A194XV43_MOLSC|nr:uncharacterized protein LY89DRAFT_11481 [Mollisia scopiformis]KUJ24078.1 hypothetical protein LY89DRAFT_11481 [Mollisia scopiformis]